MAGKPVETYESDKTVWLAVSYEKNEEISFDWEEPEYFTTKDEAFKFMKAAPDEIIIYEVKPIAKSIKDFKYEDIQK